MKGISILGSTGSIGRQTLEIAGAHAEDIRVVALAAGAGRLNLLVEQIAAFRPDLVCVPDADSAATLKERFSSAGHRPEIVYGEEGLVSVATHPAASTVVTGVVGFLGLAPTVAAVRLGKTIALANKETLVAAGCLVMPMARHHNARIVPVDSEHSAIFQSLAGYKLSDISEIWLTASGGPFRTWSREQIARATRDDALRHPNWSMGPKITIDSATLMNKGLEIIEARWLFDISPERVRVVIHPQSILHSAVEFSDRSVIGQMGLPDMRLPIHFALFWPDRVPSEQVPRLDLVKLGSLTFEEPDLERFPCLAIARRVAAHDNTLPCVLNAANEVVVESFLYGQIKFTDIPYYIEKVLEEHNPVAQPCLEEIVEANRWARQLCRQMLGSVVIGTV